MTDEITMLRNDLEYERQENNRLQAENERLANELDFIKRGRSTAAATEVRVDKMRTYTVAIICMSINGLKMEDILDKLSISKSTYYRAISEKTVSDSQHMKDLYMQYEELFNEYGVEKETYKEWVANRRAYLGKGYIRDEF